MKNNINYINSRIQAEICNESITRLSDKSLMSIYSESESVKRKIEELKMLLKEYDELRLEYSPEIAQSNNIQFKSPNSKEFKLFEIGFQNNTICYLTNLHNIITSYYADNTKLYLPINSCLDIDLGPTVLLNSNTTELNA